MTTLSSGMRAKGDRLAILTNGGGAGVLATDALDERAAASPTFPPATIAKLDAVLPPAWSRGNPVDVLGDASREPLRRGDQAVLADPERDAVLVMNCPTAVADSLDAAKAVVDSLPPDNDLPVLTCWLGEIRPRENRANSSRKRGSRPTIRRTRQSGLHASGRSIGGTRSCCSKRLSVSTSPHPDRERRAGDRSARRWRRAARS